MKIRDRLTLMLSVTALLAVSMLGLAIYLSTAQFHKKEFFKRLGERVQLTELIFLEKNEVISEAVRDRFLQRLDLEEEYAITLKRSGLDSLNRLFYQGLANELLKQDSVLFWQGQRQGMAKRYSVESGDYAVIVTALDVFGLTKLNFLKKILPTGGLLCIGLLVAVGWFSINRALMPLERKIEKARRISASELGLRLNVFNPRDELGQLAMTFNSMLDRLQAAFESQKQFVSNASHEMRNPLTAIIGEAELVLSKERSKQEYQEAMEIILQEAKRMNTLTQQLLELAKAESLSTLPDPEKISIEVCLVELIEKFPPQRLRLNFQPCEDDCDIIGNQYLLHTALANLLENALKYSGSEPVSLHFAVEPQRYRITIEDRGIGIPPGEMDKIFQPLYRARNARGLKGHGIGLALSKKIIELHNGSLFFESNVGQGTTATVLLPFC
ncbi:MAG: HAMP domain-containing sensor histidine kinase [Saprospiraceae bacterium]